MHLLQHLFLNDTVFTILPLCHLKSHTVWVDTKLKDSQVSICASADVLGHLGAFYLQFYEYY